MEDPARNDWISFDDQENFAKLYEKQVIYYFFIFFIMISLILIEIYLLYLIIILIDLVYPEIHLN